MGKRKQHQNNAVTETESGQLDIVESERPTELVKTNCPHIGRAIDSNSIKKTLKTDNLNTLGCCICSKEGGPPKKEENWVCLQCGARLCSLEHSKNHFDVPRSNLHAIAFSIHNFNIWCEPCKTLIPVEENKKLKICVGIIKQMMEKSKQVQIVVTPYNEDTPPPLVEWNESNDSESAKTASSSTTTVTSNKVPSRTDYFSRPSVRGLVNLGNTCFFNSVLQCLARTPKLVDNLRILETEEEDFKITLKSGQILEGTLERSNDWLGQCLADTLVALSKPNETTSVSPLKLLQHLRKKCPQFEGYDQHDAHELLRHLLDSVRLNDLKRYRSLVLNRLGLSRKVNPQNVSPELHKRVKALDNEVMERVTLVPEPVFKGLLVSTLECQECKNTSQCVESFLDLSLPIMADKPQPPSMVRRKGSASPELVDDKAGGMSKHQLKKQAKQARKKGRNKYGQKTGANAAADGSLPAATDSHSDKGESEADVEDNEEEKPHESGYSSEKIHSESSSLSGGDDSARTSPTTHVKEDGESNNARVAVCEGLVTVSASSSPPSTSLNPQPQYIPFLRFRRKPEESWVRAGGSLTPTWIPHSDTTYIPSPLMVMDGGESWRNYAPRNGLSPCSPLPEKDSQLNPIIEESDKVKSSESVSQETSVCDQVSLMSKVVETMLAQVNISQQDLDIYEKNVVTDYKGFIVNDYKQESDWDKDNSPTGGGDCNRLSSNNVDSATQEISRFNPFNNESCPVADKNPDSFDPVLGSQNPTGIRQNLTNVTPESENSLSNTLDNKDIEENHTLESTSELIKSEQGHNTPISATDDTSNGFHINSLYDRKATSSRDNENKEKEATDSYCPKIGPVDDRTERQKDKNYSDEDKESIDLSPIFKEVNNKKVEKKEEGDSVKYRRRFLDRESMSRNQESESDCSVQSCLSQFTALEIMSGANRVGCSTCTQRHNKGNKEGKTVNTIASKQLLIKQAPQVLILHLKRFQVQMYSFKKLSKHVLFPLYLDLSPFCLQEVEREEDGRIMYSLYGVVEHSGNLNGGHYVAYIKVEDEEKSCRWFCISDSYVHEVSESRVLQSQAYLLFYRRILMDESS